MQFPLKQLFCYRKYIHLDFGFTVITEEFTNSVWLQIKDIYYNLIIANMVAVRSFEDMCHQFNDFLGFDSGNFAQT